MVQCVVTVEFKSLQCKNFPRSIEYTVLFRIPKVFKVKIAT